MYQLSKFNVSGETLSLKKDTSRFRKVENTILNFTCLL